MDNAVALVQAYLRLNGYFTVVEHPIVLAQGRTGYRMATDLDVMAVRFPQAMTVAAARRPRHRATPIGPDPRLGAVGDGVDMLVGEVKEGKAVLNAAAADPRVLAAALVRFGCCPPESAADLVSDLHREGRVSLPHGHTLRLVSFGSTAPGGRHVHHVVTLDDVIGFLDRYLATNWAAIRATGTKDPAIGLVAILRKSGMTIVGPRNRSQEATP